MPECELHELGLVGVMGEGFPEVTLPQMPTNKRIPWPP